jgi:hypothetical protein
MGRDRPTFDADRRILVAVFCGIDWAEVSALMKFPSSEGLSLT